jgi:hypothetical protein
MPAVEYVLCLSKMIPALTDVTLVSCILPLVDRFLTRGDSYQWALGHLLLSIPFSVWRFAPDFFSNLFVSPIVVNEFMPSLVRLAFQRGFFTEDWATRIFPAQLVHAAGQNRSIRIGVAKVSLLLSALLSPKAMLGSIMTLLQWASESFEVAFLLLAHADELVTPRTVELFPKLRELFQRLVPSRDPHVRVQLPGILAGNPNVFLHGGIPLEKLVVELARDKTPEVRFAALTHFILMCERTADKASQDAFFRIFPEFFVNPLPEVRNRLCSPQTYVSFGVVRLQGILPTLLKFLPTLTLWRNIRDCVQTIQAFPGEMMRNVWPTVVPVVFKAVTHTPHPLAKVCYEFCESLASVLDPNEFTKFADMLLEAFAKHDQWAVRRLFVIVVGGLAGYRRNGTEPLDLSALFGALMQMGQDPNIAVRAAMVNQMCSLRLFFSDWQDGARGKDVVTLFMTLAKSEDPYLKEVWDKLLPKFNDIGMMTEPPTLEEGSPGWRAKSVSQFTHTVKSQTSFHRMSMVKTVSIGASRSFFGAHPLIVKPKVRRPISDSADPRSAGFVEDEAG